MYVRITLTESAFFDHAAFAVLRPHKRWIQNKSIFRNFFKRHFEDQFSNFLVLPTIPPPLLLSLANDPTATVVVLSPRCFSSPVIFPPFEVASALFYPEWVFHIFLKMISYFSNHLFQHSKFFAIPLCFPSPPVIISQVSMQISTLLLSLIFSLVSFLFSKILLHFPPF